MYCLYFPKDSGELDGEVVAILGKNSSMQIGGSRGVCFRFVLSITFAFGLCFGIYLAAESEAILRQALLGIISVSLSLSGAIFAFILPFLLSVACIAFSLPAMVIPVCFVKAVVFGFCSCGTLLVFGSSGWLIRFFLLFTDSCTLLPMLWFWLRHIDGSKLSLKRDIVICFSLFVLLCAFDYFIISPYLMMLMNL